jgi:ribosomal protein L29
MPSKTKETYIKKETSELQKILKEKEKKLFEENTNFAQRKVKDVHLPRKIRKEIAKVKTALQVRELEK